MAEEHSSCERCWADVPARFEASHEAWHASDRPWKEFFDERELERWSEQQPAPRRAV